MVVVVAAARRWKWRRRRWWLEWVLVVPIVPCDVVDEYDNGGGGCRLEGCVERVLMH